MLSVQAALFDRIQPPAAIFQLYQQRVLLRFKEARKQLDSLPVIIRKAVQCTKMKGIIRSRSFVEFLLLTTTKMGKDLELVRDKVLHEINVS